MYTRTQEKRAMIPQKTKPDLPVGQWSAAESGALTAAVLGGIAKVLLDEVTITPTIAWPQAKL